MVNVEITLSIVKKLILEQFPEWSNLPIEPVKQGGVDNRTFRLGKEMLIRLPSAEGYAAQVQKEQEWLPKLALHLSIAITKPLAQGKPSKDYPFNWSIYKWIDGESANIISLDDSQLQHIALQLAQFLNELHVINITDSYFPGTHNFWRGSHPSVYDAQVRSVVKILHDVVDIEKILTIWKKAMESKWEKTPVWVHGDFASGNILIKDGNLAAVIDFGCMGVGDPACDLTIVWTFLTSESRNVFKSNLIGLDPHTWDRAKGWALWKALITLEQIDNKENLEALKQKKVINEILKK